MRNGRGTVAALMAGLLIIVPLTVCDSVERSDDAEAEVPSATQLGELGGRIYLEPDRAEEILAEFDMDRETFAVHVRDVSSDPDRTREYSDAFEEIAGDSPPAQGDPAANPAAEEAPDGDGTA